MGIRWDEIVAMPRSLRVQFLGAMYHLMNRGDCPNLDCRL